MGPRRHFVGATRIETIISMTKKGVPFDLSKFALPPEIRERRAVVPRTIQRQYGHFVKVPGAWVEKLAQARYVVTYRVALHLLYQHWKGRGRPILLANGQLKMGGVSRGTKWRGLRELERLGLISIERRPRKSPIITVYVSEQSWSTGAHVGMHVHAP